jgi:sporulation protein YlmC with PRC-barrel domain
MSADTAREQHPLSLRLLDHQIDGPDGAALAKVDDIEISLGADALIATALLCGPGALGERLPGRLGRWTRDGWRRLSLESHPRPIRIPLDEVRQIGSAITVTEEAAKSVQQRLTLERWLLEHLIRRLPGAQVDPGEATETQPRRAADLAAPQSGDPVLRLSELLTFQALGPDGSSLGRIHEVIATRQQVRAPVLGPMPVTSYVVGPRAIGSTMGYDRYPEHGPWLLRAGILALHRRDVEVAASDVGEVDRVHRQITTRSARSRP